MSALFDCRRLTAPRHLCFFGPRMASIFHSLVLLSGHVGAVGHSVSVRLDGWLLELQMECRRAAQLAQILPTEENFLLFFRQFVSSSTEFMEAWRRYDTDRSGYIEANELKGFLSDLLKKANRNYDEHKLHEYTQTILRMFDLNGDGKLGLSEMARLLPVQENFLLKFQGAKLTSEQFNAIFTYYDKDGNGYIDEKELDALLRDLCLTNKTEADLKNLTDYKQSIMSLSDGGKLYRGELEIILCREPIQ